ncbi:channel accessory protein ArfB [Mycolicibacterium sp. XJ870]
MDFVIQWFWYLLAFLVGALVAWLTSLVAVKHTSEEAALAELPESREIGARP